jgi:hypothetical protein
VGTISELVRIALELSRRLTQVKMSIKSKVVPSLRHIPCLNSRAPGVYGRRIGHLQRGVSYRSGPEPSDRCVLMCMISWFGNGRNVSLAHASARDV